MSRILKLAEVQHRTSLSKTTIYRLMSENRFPKQIQLLNNRVGWLETEIEDWIQQEVKRSRQPTPLI